MKRKKNRVLVLFVMICSLLLINSCEKKEAGHNFHPDELTGDWDLGSVSGGYEVVTNSDQEYKDIFSPANGKITVSGDYSAELIYIFPFEGIIITEMGFMEIVEGENYPMIMMAVAENTVILNILVNDTEMVHYIATDPEFGLDFETLTISFDQLELFSFDQTGSVIGSVIVDGTIATNIIDIPANIPTEIMSFPDVGNSAVFSFETDGAFSAIFEDEEDNLIGTWEVREDNMLYIIDSTAGDGPDVDTLHFSYNIDSDELTIKMDDEMECNDENGIEEKEECLRDFEQELNFDEGSLTDVKVISIIKFTRSTSVFVPKAPGSVNWSLRKHKQLQNIDQYRTRLKKILDKRINQ